MAPRRAAAPVVAGILLATAACGVRAESEPALPSVADFFRVPDITDEQLSPSGQYLAILARGESGRTRLVTIDLATPNKAQTTFQFDDADIRSLRWVNDKRLAFSVWDPTGERDAGRGGLIAMDRDGSNMVRLVSTDYFSKTETTGHIKKKLQPNTYSYFSSVHDDSDDIIVSEDRCSSEGCSRNFQRVLHRMNTRTGDVTDLTVGQPPGVVGWLLDPDGAPRVAVAAFEGRRIVYARGQDSKTWDVLGDFDQFTSGEFIPEFIGFDGALYAGHQSMGALYRYDLGQHRFDADPVLRLAGFELSIGPEVDHKARKVLGIHYLTDARGTFWLDPRFSGFQKKVDTALPQTINTITCGDCVSSKFLLVRSSSDRQPTQYFLYDVGADRLLGVGSQRPWIKQAQMGRRDFIRYSARDGLSIPAYVTVPPAAYQKPYPLIVLVHGGPWVRGGTWEWDPEVQFLASRGYAVIQPEYRGSRGFGFDHFKAGWRQWGLAMQDDLADAAHWAVTQGIADPNRIAIAGASYGGYASLMGLIRSPELFKCAVEWVGVADLKLMYTVQWSDTSEVYLQYGAPVLVGDPVKDAEQFKATSPLQNAQRITQPILMAYGSLDSRVPLIHGEKLHSAIATPKDEIEWIVYPYEGHGWSIEKDNVDFWTRVEKFLDRYLKPIPTNAKAAVTPAVAIDPAASGAR
jgi:dipeptidyl aminopeptidase/acylaminoacyl peptidase